MQEVYEVPENIKEIFTDDAGEYKIINHEFEMDNVEAMRHFIETVGIPEDNILVDDGTQITLIHKDYPNKVIVLDSSGLGDFWSHRFEITEMARDEV